MSDSELDTIRRRRLLELRRKLAPKQREIEATDPEEVLNRIFKDRAWEVFNSASFQFPEVMSEVKELLVKEAASGNLKEVTGEQLYIFLAHVGLRVRLNTKIEFASHGELKSLEDKLRDELRKT
jgi:DNA-binding TFAR19-related protein (PDSD5 family)